MKRKKKVYYLIRRNKLEEWMGVAAVMDMLRYDGARVEPNAPTGFYLLSNEHGPEVQRWKSFGIEIDAVLKDQFEAHDVARKLSEVKK